MSTAEHTNRELHQQADFERFAPEIVDQINRDPALGVLFLVDPARVIEELGYRLTDELREQVRRSMLGVTHTQMESYQNIQERLRKGEVVSGIRAVRLRHRRRYPSNSARVTSTTASAVVGQNPLGGYDLVINITDTVAERIAVLAYEDGVIPHRLQLPPEAQFLGQELVIGRPKSISLGSEVENSVSLQLPFAVVNNGKSTAGQVTLLATVNTVEKNGQPEYLAVSLVNISSLTVGSKNYGEMERDLLKLLLQKWISAKGGLPISPLLQQALSTAPMQQQGWQVEDFDVKVCKAVSGVPHASIAACVNLKPHANAGTIANVLPFVKEHWGIGINERLLHMALDAWWSSPDGLQFHRLNKSKLENAKTLAQQGKIEELFDPNGSIVIGSIQFSVQQDYLEIQASITAENEFLWVDADIDLTAKATIEIHGKSHKLVVTVTHVDSSVTCWTKFLMALVGGLFGLLGGAIIGGVVGAIVGGVAGIAVSGTVAGVVGTAIGASAGALVGGIVSGLILPAIAQALINNKLAVPFGWDLVPVKFDWQIPHSDIVLFAAGTWAKTLPGEILLGGTLDMPEPLTPGIELVSLDTDSASTDVVLPWATGIKGLSSGGNYLAAYSARIAAHPTALETPLSCHWFCDGNSIKGDGSEVLITVTPSIGYRAALPGTAPEPFLAVTKTICVMSKDGTKGEPLILTTEVDSPVFTYSEPCKVSSTVVDVVGTQVQASTVFSFPVLGDYWAELLEEFWRGRDLEPKLSPAEFPKPGPPEHYRSLQGLRAGRASAGRSLLSHRRLDLAHNIELVPIIPF